MKREAKSKRRKETEKDKRRRVRVGVLEAEVYFVNTSVAIFILTDFLRRSKYFLAFCKVNVFYESKFQNLFIRSLIY